jgi:hypothetical protein
MKTIRSKFPQARGSHSVSLSFRTGREGCGLGTASFAVPDGYTRSRTETRRSSRKPPAQIDSLFWYSRAAGQKTEFWENASFALLGASGFIGVAVSLF